MGQSTKNVVVDYIGANQIVFTRKRTERWIVNPGINECSPELWMALYSDPTGSLASMVEAGQIVIKRRGGLSEFDEFDEDEAQELLDDVSEKSSTSEVSIPQTSIVISELNAAEARDIIRSTFIEAHLDIYEEQERAREDVRVTVIGEIDNQREKLDESKHEETE